MVFSLNIDLIKSYDRVDLSYPKLILLQIGLSLDMVEWIMSAITIAQFVVLINSVPTELFKGVDVYVTSERIHLYISCIIPQCLFQEVSVM